MLLLRKACTSGSTEEVREAKPTGMQQSHISHRLHRLTHAPMLLRSATLG